MEEQIQSASQDIGGCFINIQSTSEPSTPPSVPNSSCRRNSYTCGSPESGPLKILNLVTDAVLIIGAVIFIISLVIVFSIVGLAVIRVYSVRCYYDSNVSNRRFMSNVNNTCGILAS